MVRTIKIAIADDHTLFVSALSRVIQNEPGFLLLHASSNGRDLLHAVNQNPPDVILLDLDMPILHGRDALIELRKATQDIRVIILSMHYSEFHIANYVRLGANGYLPKDVDYEELRTAIHEVHDTGYYFNDDFSRELLEELISQKSISLPPVSSDPLTEREVDVLRLVCKEMTSGQIAEQLNLSQRTVENHRHRLSKKIGSNGSIGLYLFALRNGYVDFRH